MDESQKKQAQITCLRLLAASPKSRKELEKKLSDKGYPAEVITKTLSGLEEQGLLSDKAYAQNLVTRFTLGKPSGSRKISFELKRHGISENLREEILTTLDPEDERTRARELGESRWAGLGRLNPEKRKKRVYDFLLRRGFDFQLVRETIEYLEHGLTDER